MVFDNLISNAKKAGARCMEWQIKVEPRRVQITVSNDGKPMNEKIQGSLFELGASATGGSGIGLFTCKEYSRAWVAKLPLSAMTSVSAARVSK